jgi:hypothetical protein
MYPHRTAASALWLCAVAGPGIRGWCGEGEKQASWEDASSPPDGEDVVAGAAGRLADGVEVAAAAVAATDAA